MTYDLTRQDLQIVLFLRCTTEEKHRLIAEARVTLTALLPTVRAAMAPRREGARPLTRTPRPVTRGGLGSRTQEPHNVQHRRMNNCFTAPDNMTISEGSPEGKMKIRPHVRPSPGSPQKIYQLGSHNTRGTNVTRHPFYLQVGP